MPSIQTNIAANNAYRNLAATSSRLDSSIAKLSSGFRINKASDDAAGLSIANKLHQDNRALMQASRNASQAGSVLSIADGAVSTITDMLGRMKELAIQAGSDNVTSSDRAKIDAEYQKLYAEIDRTVDNTSYQGGKLLDGSYGVNVGTVGGGSTLLGITGVSNVTVSGVQTGQTIAVTGTSATSQSATNAATGVTQVVTTTAGGAGVAQTVNFDKLGLSFTYTGTIAAATLTGNVVTAGGGGNFQVGSDANADSHISINLGNLKASSATGLNLVGTDLTTYANAQTAISSLDTALGSANTVIGDIGAAESRLEYTTANLASRIQNTSAAESVIRDADMAYEMTQFTKTQILQQAGTAMLAQANSAASGVLTLLRG
jgi:flagellin